MNRAPKKPADIFPEITEDYRKVFGEDLISLILYGSGASGEYIPGKSDLNFLVVLSEGGIGNLEKAIDFVKRWRKRGVTIPLCMTKEDVTSSIDAYPVEFFTMQLDHITVYGEDVLVGLAFEPGSLRLQVERELKSKILHLRTGLLDTGGKSGPVRELIKVSFTAFMSLFKALLHLKGLAVPRGRREVIRLVAETYSIEAEIFLKCADIKEGIDRVPASEILGVCKAYLKEAARLSKIVDGMRL
jgi:hypothetical protein